MTLRKKMAHLLHIFLQRTLLATLISRTTIWTIILWLSVPSLWGSFILWAQSSFILQLLMPYALHCAEMVYKAWNVGKKIFDSTANRKFLQSKVYFLPFRSRSNVLPLFVATKVQNRSKIMSQPRILTKLTLPQSTGNHQTYSSSYFINISWTDNLHLQIWNFLQVILCTTCSVKATRGSKRFMAQFVNDQ